MYVIPSRCEIHIPYSHTEVLPHVGTGSSRSALWNSKPDSGLEYTAALHSFHSICKRDGLHDFAARIHTFPAFNSDQACNKAAVNNEYIFDTRAGRNWLLALWHGTIHYCFRLEPIWLGFQ